MTTSEIQAPTAKQIQVRVSLPAEDPVGLHDALKDVPVTMRPKYARELMLLGLAFARMSAASGSLAGAPKLVLTPAAASSSAQPRPSERRQSAAALSDSDVRAQGAADGGAAFNQAVGSAGRSMFTKGP